jgi:hypothetical protein
LSFLWSFKWSKQNRRKKNVLSTSGEILSPKTALEGAETEGDSFLAGKFSLHLATLTSAMCTPVQTTKMLNAIHQENRRICLE